MIPYTIKIMIYIIIFITATCILYMFTNLIHCKSFFCTLSKQTQSYDFDENTLKAQLYKMNDQPPDPDEFKDSISFLDQYYTKIYERSIIDRPNSKLPLYYTYKNSIENSNVRVYCAPSPTPDTILSCYKNNPILHYYNVKCDGCNDLYSKTWLQYDDIGNNITTSDVYDLMNIKCIQDESTNVSLKHCDGREKFDDTLDLQTNILLNSDLNSTLNLIYNEIYALIDTFGFKGADKIMVDQYNTEKSL